MPSLVTETTVPGTHFPENNPDPSKNTKFDRLVKPPNDNTFVEGLSRAAAIRAGGPGKERFKRLLDRYSWGIEHSSGYEKARKSDLLDLLRTIIFNYIPEFRPTKREILEANIAELDAGPLYLDPKYKPYWVSRKYPNGILYTEKNKSLIRTLLPSDTTFVLNPDNTTLLTSQSDLEQISYKLITEVPRMFLLEFEDMDDFVRRAMCKYAHRELERHPRAISNSMDLPRDRAGSEEEVCRSIDSRSFTVSELLLSNVPGLPLTFQFDPKGKVYPCRGRGPLFRHNSSAIDSMIVAGRLLNAGSTVCDFGSGANWESTLTEVAYAYMEASSINWEILSESASKQCRDILNQMIHYGRSEASTPQSIWEICAKGYRQCQIRNKLECRGSSQKSHVMIIEGSPYVTVYGRVGNYDMGSLLQRALRLKIRGPLCPKCRDPCDITPHGLPLRLAVRLETDVLPPSHTSENILVSTECDQEIRKVVPVSYRWIGGVYPFQIAREEVSYKVVWRDNDLGEEKAYRIYDSKRCAGAIIGNIIIQDIERELKNCCFDKHKPLLFYERVVIKGSSVITAKNTLEHMYSVLGSMTDTRFYFPPQTNCTPPKRHPPNQLQPKYMPQGFPNKPDNYRNFRKDTAGRERNPATPSVSQPVDSAGQNFDNGSHLSPKRPNSFKASSDTKGPSQSASSSDSPIIIYERPRDPRAKHSMPPPRASEPRNSHAPRKKASQRPASVAGGLQTSTSVHKPTTTRHSWPNTPSYQQNLYPTREPLAPSLQPTISRYPNVQNHQASASENQGSFIPRVSAAPQPRPAERQPKKGVDKVVDVESQTPVNPRPYPKQPTPASYEESVAQVPNSGPSHGSITQQPRYGEENAGAEFDRVIDLGTDPSPAIPRYNIGDSVPSYYYGYTNTANFPGIQYPDQNEDLSLDNPGQNYNLTVDQIQEQSQSLGGQLNIDNTSPTFWNPAASHLPLSSQGFMSPYFGYQAPIAQSTGLFNSCIPTVPASQPAAEGEPPLNDPQTYPDSGVYETQGYMASQGPPQHTPSNNLDPSGLSYADQAIYYPTVSQIPPVSTSAQSGPGQIHGYMPQNPVTQSGYLSQERPDPTEHHAMKRKRSLPNDEKDSNKKSKRS